MCILKKLLGVIFKPAICMQKQIYLVMEKLYLFFYNKAPSLCIMISIIMNRLKVLVKKLLNFISHYFEHMKSEYMPIFFKFVYSMPARCKNYSYEVQNTMVLLFKLLISMYNYDYKSLASNNGLIILFFDLSAFILVFSVATWAMYLYLKGYNLCDYFLISFALFLNNWVFFFMPEKMSLFSFYMLVNNVVVYKSTYGVVYTMFVFLILLYLSSALPRYKLVDFQNKYWKELVVYSYIVLLIFIMFGA